MTAGVKVRKEGNRKARQLLLKKYYNSVCAGNNNIIMLT